MRVDSKFKVAEGGRFELPCHLRDAWFSRPARYGRFGIPPYSKAV